MEKRNIVSLKEYRIHRARKEELERVGRAAGKATRKICDALALRLVEAMRTMLAANRQAG